MMVSSFEYPSLAIPLKTETTKQLHMMYLLSTFVVCLGIGCLLMLPLAPHYRPVGAHYSAALVPLLFIWWGIILPVVIYWLFQQYISAHWGEAHITRCDMQDLFALVADFQIATAGSTGTVERRRSDIEQQVWSIVPSRLAKMTNHRSENNRQMREALQPLVHAGHDQQATFCAGP